MRNRKYVQWTYSIINNYGRNENYKCVIIKRFDTIEIMLNGWKKKQCKNQKQT